MTPGWQPVPAGEAQRTRPACPPATGSARYAEALTTAELNSSFYRWPARAVRQLAAPPARWLPALGQGIARPDLRAQAVQARDLAGAHRGRLARAGRPPGGAAGAVAARPGPRRHKAGLLPRAGPSPCHVRTRSASGSTANKPSPSSAAILADVGPVPPPRSPGARRAGRHAGVLELEVPAIVGAVPALPQQPDDLQRLAEPLVPGLPGGEAEAGNVLVEPLPPADAESEPAVRDDGQGRRGLTLTTSASPLLSASALPYNPEQHRRAGARSAGVCAGPA
jgi:hypothetical protein